MFFTFFKGEKHANQIYEMLEPVVCMPYDQDAVINEDDPRANEENKFV